MVDAAACIHHLALPLRKFRASILASSRVQGVIIVVLHTTESTWTNPKSHRLQCATTNHTAPHPLSGEEYHGHVLPDPPCPPLDHDGGDLSPLLQLFFPVDAAEAPIPSGSSARTMTRGGTYISQARVRKVGRGETPPLGTWGLAPRAARCLFIGRSRSDAIISLFRPGLIVVLDTQLRDVQPKRLEHPPGRHVGSYFERRSPRHCRRRRRRCILAAL